MRVWDNMNKQWLIVMFLFLDDDGNVFHCRAKTPGSTPMVDGWYDFNEEKLNHISINGPVVLNPELMPTDG